MANIIGPKKGEAWEKQNADNPDVSKTWLRRDFYRHGYNDITGKRTNNVVNGPFTDQYREGFDAAFSSKEVQPEVDPQMAIEYLESIEKALDQIRRACYYVEVVDGTTKLFDKDGGLICKVMTKSNDLNNKT